MAALKRLIKLTVSNKIRIMVAGQSAPHDYISSQDHIRTRSDCVASFNGNKIAISTMKKRVTKPMDYKELSSSTECGRVMTIKRAQPKQTRKVLPPFIPVQFGPGEKLINQKPKVLKQPTEALSAKGSTRAAPSLSSGSLSSGEEYASEDEAMPNINLILSIINQSEDSLGDGDDDDLSQDEIEDEMEEEADQIVKSDERSESNGSLQESDQSANAVSYEIINNEEELLNALEDIGLQPEVSDVVGELNHPQKNLYVKRPDGVFIELTEEEIIKTITEKLSLMVPVNVARIIIETKNDISRIKHALELLAIRSPGLDETHQSIPSEFLFPLDSLPVETEEDFATLCRALKDLPF
ncbi:hypothetical protein OUZ56_032917 [Daphnia magna]|uniref:Uncharacterized protein n=1 Tax=Daphnia magna TaxID=35525 RepID=A0ABQ9ZX74_9CRUS|nr:hypothetical protein OUZ56_032917 [Daphnia magna]